MDSNTKIRILLVDDQQLFIKGLQVFMSNYAEDMCVVGIAKDGEEAIRMARNLKPEIILMDVYMENMDGVEATRIIHKDLPDVKILMLSTYDEDDYVKQAILAGASGYLLKDVSPTGLLVSIRALKTGVVQVSPSLVNTLLQRTYVDGNNTYNGVHQKVLSSLESKLSKRERKIFILIATGFENNAIAEKLGISEQTVKNYVSEIYKKLNVKNRFEIIRMANS